MFSITNPSPREYVSEVNLFGGKQSHQDRHCRKWGGQLNLTLLHYRRTASQLNYMGNEGEFSGRLSGAKAASFRQCLTLAASVAGQPCEYTKKTM
jgi:hypothetical protein